MQRFAGLLAAAIVLPGLAMADSKLTLVLGGEGLAAPDIRPQPIWIVPTLEWAVVIGILAWTFASSFTWWRAERGARA